MHRDPSVVGRARIFAETAAQVVNGFVEEISWKTLVGTACVYVCRVVLNVCNFIQRDSHLYLSASSLFSRIVSLTCIELGTHLEHPPQL